MSVPATLIRISTGEVLQRGLLPVADPLNETVPGLNPELEWLIDHEVYAPPLYDARVHQLITTMEPTGNAHPDYPLYNEYRITYTTQRRAVEEIKEHIINRERNEFQKHVDHLKLVTLAVEVLARQMQGMQLTPTERYIMDRQSAAAVKIFKNHQRRKQLEAEAEQNQPLDIDAGWEAPDDNEPI